MSETVCGVGSERELSTEDGLPLETCSLPYEEMIVVALREREIHTLSNRMRTTVFSGETYEYHYL